jgi:hypothetical protein
MNEWITKILMCVVTKRLCLRLILIGILFFFLIWGREARKGAGHFERFYWSSENWDYKPGTGHQVAGITFSRETESHVLLQGTVVLPPW